MIASLPMYWRDETAQAWRAMWADIQAVGRAQGIYLPDLTPPEDIPEPWSDHWLRDDLVLSQTCSLPFRTTLRDQVAYVGTFDFGLDAPPGFYASVLVTRADDPVERLALNGYDSQSGWAAAQGVFSGETPALGESAKEHVVTGGHAKSLAAVAEERVDAAYLDAVTWKICQTYDAYGSTVQNAGLTLSTPGLPLITAKHRDPAPLRAVLRAAFDSEPRWRNNPALGGLRDFVVLDEALYYDLPIPPAPEELT